MRFLLGTFANIHTNLIPPENRVPGLHLSTNIMGLSSEVLIIRIYMEGSVNTARHNAIQCVTAIQCQPRSLNLVPIKSG